VVHCSLLKWVFSTMTFSRFFGTVRIKRCSKIGCIAQALHMAFLDDTRGRMILKAVTFYFCQSARGAADSVSNISEPGTTGRQQALFAGVRDGHFFQRAFVAPTASDLPICEGFALGLICLPGISQAIQSSRRYFAPLETDIHR